MYVNPKDDDVVKRFGDAVRAYRKQKGLTMVELAAECEVDYTTISNIERGLVNTTITMAARIAKVLDIKVTLLLDSQII